LIVEFAVQRRGEGLTLKEAAIEGGKLRFRPILMTSFAFILGCVPLWTATGSGAVSRRVLGTAVIGGMLAATLISIFLIPVMFDFVESLSVRFSKQKDKEKERPAPEPVPEPTGVA
jgi:HAE1 family hydrophobic/amphiphilic exporter-1